VPDVPLFYVLDKFVEKKIRTYTSCSETVFRRSTQIYRNNKIRLYETFIKPVLCYGSIHWTLTEMTLQQVLRTFDSLALWKIINEEDAVLIPKKLKRQLFYKTTTVQKLSDTRKPIVLIRKCLSYATQIRSHLIRFRHILHHIYAYVFEVVPFLQVSPPNFCMYLSFSPHAPHAETLTHKSNSSDVHGNKVIT